MPRRAMPRAALPRPVAAAAALIGLLLLARGWTARAAGTEGVLEVGDNPTCYEDSKTCPLGVAVQSYLDDKATMTVSVARGHR